MKCSINSFDPTYNNNYNKRNQLKVDAILKCLDNNVNSILDLGCNAGYLEEEIFKKNDSIKVHAVELNRSIIKKELFSEPNFKFFEEDVVNFDFKNIYDVIIYNAVHHHIFGKYGKKVAFEIWQKIIDHCDNYIIFETGLIEEDGDFYWKEELMKNYSQDKDHLTELFRAIGPRLKKIEVITELEIHGVKRSIYKISLQGINTQYNLKAKIDILYSKTYNPSDEWQEVCSYKRTKGSQNQILISDLTLSEKKFYDTQVYEYTQFYLLKNLKNRSLSFAKKELIDPYKQMREYYILTNVSHPNIIKLVCMNEKYGLIFPYIPYSKLSEVCFNTIKNKQEFKSEIIQFYNFARNCTLSMGMLDYETSSDEKRFLIDIIDIHINNILVLVENNMIKDWVVIDMEYFDNYNSERNTLNETEILDFIEGKKSIIKSLKKLF